MFRYPNKLYDLFFSISKVYFYYKFISFFGFILGSIIFSILVKAYHMLQEKYLNYTKLNTMDLSWIGDHQKNTINIVGIADLGDFSKEKMKEFMISTLSKVKNMNSRLKYFMGNLFWEQMELNESRIKELINEEHSVKNYDEALKFAYKHVNIPLDMNVKAFECFILPYTDPAEKGNGAIIFKIDHTLTDGLNGFSLILTMADNFNLDLFPKKYEVNTKISLIQKIKNLCGLVIHGWGYLFKALTIKSNNKLFTGVREGETKIGKPVEFDLEDIKKLSKAHNVTVNEIIVSLICITIKKLSPESTDTTVCVPIGNTKVPTSLSQVTLKNDLGIINTLIPLIDDLKSGAKIISQELKQLVQKKLFADSLYYFLKVFSEFLPIFAFKEIIHLSADAINMTVSNVPGSTKPLFYNGCRIKKILAFNSVGMNRCFNIITSYDGKVTLVPMLEKNQKLDPEEYGSMLKSVFQKELKSLDK